MFWIIVVHLMFAGPNGEIVDLAAALGSPIAYADRAQCEAVASAIAARTNHKAECRAYKVDGGKDASAI